MVSVAELLAAIVAGQPHLDGCLCRQQPHLFDSLDPHSIAEAQRLCAQCPARAPCRAWLETRGRHLGVGGVIAGEVVKPRGPAYPKWMLVELHTTLLRRPNRPPASTGAPRREQATAFLTRRLADGPERSDVLAAAAATLGIPRHQLQLARVELGARVERVGQHTVWMRAR